jgi:hypothetical protein
MTTGPSWRAIGRGDAARLVDARLQTHHALQWLARAGRAYVPAHPGDGHTNLGWDDALGGFATHPLQGGARLALRLSDLTLALYGAGNPPRSLGLDGRTETDVRAWMRAQMAALGLDPDALDAPSPYAMPAHAVGRGAAYAVAAGREGFGMLAAWFANAEASLGRSRSALIARGLAPSPLRCWPHHFDLATLTPLDAADPEHGRSVNPGFSPGDEHYAEPYFYVSPWPYPEAHRLPRLPPVAHWHTQPFLAAIAPANRIVAAASPQAAAEAFLADAVEGVIAVLR